jgi:CBS domain containing-hemolysin-like protein
MNPSLMPVRLILILLFVAAAFALRLLATAIRHLDPTTRALAAERGGGRAPNGGDEPRILGVLERFVRAASDLEAGALLALAIAAGLAATAFPSAIGLGIAIAVAFALTPFFLGVLPERAAAGRVAAVLARATPAILLLAAVFHPLTILRDIFAFPIERLLSIRLGRSVHGPAVPAAAETGPAAIAAEHTPGATPAASAPAGSGSGGGLRQVLDFTRATVNEVMTPRSEIVAVESGASLADLTEIVRTTRHGSYPIYRTTLEEVVGKVSLIDVLGEIDPTATVDQFRSEVTVVPESKRVIELAPDIRSKRLGMVMVVDEFGSVSGLGNLHDLVKALVGEIIEDEAEPEGGDGSFEARRLDLHTWILNPRTRVERVNEILGLALPEGDYQTLGGFILDQMGRIPLPREHLRFADGEFEILAADERRVLSVRFRRLVPGARA